MQISEIFPSIEGEGIRSGCLCTFIRTFGCNLRCSYCDSLYAIDRNKGRYSIFSVEEILRKCKKLGNKRVTFTGGEPLLQKDSKELIEKLLDENFEVNIETNGAVDIKEYIYIQNKDMSNLIITMDWKSPSSGMHDKMIKSNLDFLRPNDVLKFVVGSIKDLEDVKKVLLENTLHCNIFISPVFGEIKMEEIVEFMKENQLQKARFQLQIHKFVWPPEMRGV